MLEWLDEQLVPALGNQPSFLVMDLFAAHKTEEVLDTLRANDITVSIVGDTLMAARSPPNDDWGSVGNGAKSRRKARKCWLWYV